MRWQNKCSTSLANTHNPLLHPLPGVPWEVTIDSQPISADPCPAILDHLSWQIALDYWITKTTLMADSAMLIDWPLWGAVLQAWPPTYCMWASKFASGHSAVAQTMAQWKKWDSPFVPSAT